MTRYVPLSLAILMAAHAAEARPVAREIAPSIEINIDVLQELAPAPEAPAVATETTPQKPVAQKPVAKKKKVKKKPRKKVTPKLIQPQPEKVFVDPPAPAQLVPARPAPAEQAVEAPVVEAPVVAAPIEEAPVVAAPVVETPTPEETPVWKQRLDGWRAKLRGLVEKAKSYLQNKEQTPVAQPAEQPIAEIPETAPAPTPEPQPSFPAEAPKEPAAPISVSPPVEQPVAHMPVADPTPESTAPASPIVTEIPESPAPQIPAEMVPAATPQPDMQAVPVIPVTPAEPAPLQPAPAQEIAPAATPATPPASAMRFVERVDGFLNRLKHFKNSLFASSSTNKEKTDSALPAAPPEVPAQVVNAALPETPPASATIPAPSPDAALPSSPPPQLNLLASSETQLPQAPSFVVTPDNETKQAKLPEAPPVDPFASANATLPVSYTVLFAASSEAVAESDKPALETLSSSLKINKDSRVNLMGYAAIPEKGSDSDARNIALKRVLAVRGVLIGHGIDSARINVQALGANTTSAVKDRVDIIKLD